MDNETKVRLEKAEKQIEMLIRKLDEARHACGLAGLIDDQLFFINRRQDRADGSARVTGKGV